VPLLVARTNLASLKDEHEVGPKILKTVGELTNVVDRQEVRQPAPQFSGLKPEKVGQAKHELFLLSQQDSSNGRYIHAMVG
jgi:hypothetical protein